MARRCLVVDDTIETVDIVGYVLQKAGYEVLTAFDGEKGLELAQTQHPDIIVLDIMMPIMDGLTMNIKLKENEATRNIPVIIMSARAYMGPMFESSTGAPVQAYMVKPFRPQELLDKMDELLGGAGA